MGERPQYLIQKYGGYYRPDSAGYTASKSEAGRYSLAEAISISHPNGNGGPRDGMSYIHEDAVPDAKNSPNPCCYTDANGTSCKCRMRAEAMTTEAALALPKIAALVEAAKIIAGRNKFANPMRSADMHKSNCQCIRCHYDALDAALAAIKEPRT